MFPFMSLFLQHMEKWSPHVYQHKTSSDSDQPKVHTGSHKETKDFPLGIFFLIQLSHPIRYV